MANEQLLKPWRDETSWREILQLVHNPDARILVVAREHRQLWTVEREFPNAGDPGLLYSVADSRAVFSNGAVVQLATIRDVCVYYYMRGHDFDVAYLISAQTWRAIDRDCVARELLPALGRRTLASVLDCIACGTPTTKTFTLTRDNVTTSEHWTAIGVPFCKACYSDLDLVKRVADTLYRKEHNANL